MKTRILMAVTLAGAALATAVAPAHAGAPTTYDLLDGYDERRTPARYDRVGVLRTGSPRARHVLILVTGTSGGSTYFAPLAQSIVARRPDWQVWSVERRENLLEDHSRLDLVKERRIGLREFFDYYLGHLTDDSVEEHYETPSDRSVAFGRRWGMKVAVHDLRRVVRTARRLGGRVVLGGHSLGATIATAYATWDFGGRAGARDLHGLILLDGGSGTTAISPEAAGLQLAALEDGSPWLAFGGIPAPLAGLFNIVGSTATKLRPHARNIFEGWPLLPANLRPPVPVTNEAGYGHALDEETSPASLRAAHVNAGRLARSGNPRGWDRNGELSPIQRVADMYSGTGFRSLDGTAWFHPRRLTLDAGAVAAGNRNPAQDVLDVDATRGDELDHLRIYGFGARLGGPRVLAAAQLLAEQSGIPRSRLTLINRERSYTHIDPLSAAPRNDFVRFLGPFLDGVRGG